ncbi:Pigr [Columba livia]|nr:Pigr [Columba livia]
MAILFLLAALLQEPVSSTLYGFRFLTGKVGGSVTHQCFYSITPANKHDRKYWCKIAGSGVCHTVISTTGYISKQHVGRVSLEDIPQNGTFTVTMTELEKNDTGTYRCGIGTTNRDLFVSLNLTVLADAAALGPTELVWGELHGSVTVLCPPGDTRGGEKRFWCKLGRNGCALIANTGGYVGKSYQGRIFITPQESSGVFKILINDLKKEDSGLYMCGTGKLSGGDSLQAVALQVTTASTLPKRPKLLSGTVGGSLSLKCHYDPQGNYEQKYLCRWKEASCALLVDADGFVHESYKGRIQITSGAQENGTYTVVMSHLREEDAGWYWCGAKNGHTEHTSSVKLLIQKESCSLQDPETSTLVKRTLSIPAAYGMLTQRSITGLTYTVSTVTENSITGLMYVTGTSTESTSIPLSDDDPDTFVTKSTSILLPTDHPGTFVTESTSILLPTDHPVTFVTESTSILLPTDHPGTFVTESTSILLSNDPPNTFVTRTISTPLSPNPLGTFVTSPGENYESSSSESHLLPVVLPALILLIFITVTILVLIKIKLQKEMGGERSAMGDLEAAPIRSDPNPVKEQMMEETPRPEKVQECRTESGKCRIIYAILGRFRMIDLYLEEITAFASLVQGRIGGNAGLEVRGVFKTARHCQSPVSGCGREAGHPEKVLGSTTNTSKTRSGNARKMTLLAFAFLLAFLPAESANSRYPPKAAISSPVFGPGQVYGLLNGSVTVKCFYPPTRVNRHDRKYWCRESGTSCRTVASTSGYTAPGYRHRISITDYPQAENFQIDISGLTAADAGTYQCGIGINGRGLSHKVSLDVSEGPHETEGAELFYVKLHSTLTMSCSFGKDNESVRKYLCKMEKDGCHDIVDSYGKVDEDYMGRVLLTNEQSPGSFSVVITQMDWEDSGLYLCGAGKYGETGETKELDVHVYEETNVPQVKPTIIGVKGSSVTFECHYEPRKRSSMKYWCKWRQNGCARIIDTTGYVSGPYEGRVAIIDSPANNTMTIILNQLKDSDKGYYWCMTDEEKEQQSSAELKVIDGEPGLKGKKEVEAQAGSRLDLTCSYPCKYYSYQKYWCKWGDASCTPMPAADQRQPGPDVTCDTDNKTVVLSFDSVAKTDQGWYWCGVKRDGLFGETMAVHLEVTEADSESSDQRQGHSALPLALGLAGTVILVLVAAFAIFKYRQLKRSDLVSVGSYRTNISMSDFESVKEYSASNNACVKDTQETQIGGDELITTAATPESAAEIKKAKRSSKEDADLAYSTYLLTSNAISQGGSGGDSAVPDMAPPKWEGQI